VQIYLDMAMIVLSIALIAIIILQSRGAGLGGLSGGDYSGSGYHVRRGLERTMFQATIGLSILFFALAILSVILLS
jgi:preprotein translocase subunit SecG